MYTNPAVRYVSDGPLTATTARVLLPYSIRTWTTSNVDAYRAAIEIHEESTRVLEAMGTEGRQVRVIPPDEVADQITVSVEFFRVGKKKYRCDVSAWAVLEFEGESDFTTRMTSIAGLLDAGDEFALRYTAIKKVEVEFGRGRLRPGLELTEGESDPESVDTEDP